MNNSQLTVKEGISNLQQYSNLLTEDQLKVISLIHLKDDEEDQMVFIHSSNGKFTVKSYIKQLNPPQSQPTWHHLVW